MRARRDRALRALLLNVCPFSAKIARRKDIGSNNSDKEKDASVVCKDTHTDTRLRTWSQEAHLWRSPIQPRLAQAPFGA